jgi:electron transport complex protein RnfE
MGAGFTMLLATIGFFRELIGSGTILSGLDLLTGGEPMRGLVLVDGGWLLAILPPGAFFALALAVAAKNVYDFRRRTAGLGSSRKSRSRKAART